MFDKQSILVASSNVQSNLQGDLFTCYLQMKEWETWDNPRLSPLHSLIIFH